MRRLGAAIGLCVSVIAATAPVVSAACSANDPGATSTATPVPDAGPDPDGGPCMSDIDCPAGADHPYSCLFDIASGCSAKSWCVLRVILPGGAGNCGTKEACACDGGGVTLGPGCGRPEGYAIAPVRSDNACFAPSSDAGDAGAEADADASR